MGFGSIKSTKIAFGQLGAGHHFIRRLLVTKLSAIKREYFVCASFPSNLATVKPSTKQLHDGVGQNIFEHSPWFTFEFSSFAHLFDTDACGCSVARSSQKRIKNTILDKFLIRTRLAAAWCVRGQNESKTFCTCIPGGLPLTTPSLIRGTKKDPRP